MDRALGVAHEASGAPAETTVFHATNLLLHVIAGLLLFAVIRATLRVGRVSVEWKASAERIPAIAAGLWLVHPIQTDAVDYLSQRTEILVTVFYLATLYFAVLAWTHEGLASASDAAPRRKAHWWLAASILACLLGMGTKEVMLTAPFVVILYDRTFISPSWSSLWGRWDRRVFYGLLGATMLLSLTLVLHGARSATVGFGPGETWYEYLYSQGWAISVYLRLILWPDQLIYDYGQTPVRGLQGVPGAVCLVVAGVLSFIAWRRDGWRWAGFLGWFFLLVLAPSSSVIPIRTEVAAERRIYLASVAVIVLLVVAVETMYRRGTIRVSPTSEFHRLRSASPWWPVSVTAVAYFGLCTWTAREWSAGEIGRQIAVRLVVATFAAGICWALTIARFRLARVAGTVILSGALLAASSERSAMYSEPALLWRDAFAKRPTNGRAANGIAASEMQARAPRLVEADSFLQRAVLLDSTLTQARVNRAVIAVHEARLTDAESLLVHALAIDPGDSAATDLLGRVLTADGQPDRAIPYLESLVRVFPSAVTFKTLGVAFLITGRVDSAAALLHHSVALDSNDVEALRNLGGALIERDRGAEATPILQRVVRLEPRSAAALAMLSLASAEAGNSSDAESFAAAAVALDSTDLEVRLFAGRALDRVGRQAEAMTMFLRAAALQPGDPRPLTSLGVLLARTGRKVDAERLLREVLRRVPTYGPARAALSAIRASASIRP